MATEEPTGKPRPAKRKKFTLAEKIVLMRRFRERRRRRASRCG